MRGRRPWVPAPSGEKLLEIAWLGGDALLLRGREARVLLAPSSVPVPSGVDIVVGGGGDGNLLRPDGGPQVVARPGEYELRGVTVHGVALPTGTAFVAIVDEVPVCNFGALPTEFPEDTLESIGVVDVLAVSLEGGAPGRAVSAAALVGRLQPAVVVPIGFEPVEGGVPEALAAFIKEMGVGEVHPQARLSLSGFSGGSEDTRVVVLEPRR